MKDKAKQEEKHLETKIKKSPSLNIEIDVGRISAGSGISSHGHSQEHIDDGHARSVINQKDSTGTYGINYDTDSETNSSISSSSSSDDEKSKSLGSSSVPLSRTSGTTTPSGLMTPKRGSRRNSSVSKIKGKFFSFLLFSSILRYQFLSCDSYQFHFLLTYNISPRRLHAVDDKRLCLKTVYTFPLLILIMNDR